MASNARQAEAAFNLSGTHAPGSASDFDRLTHEVLRSFNTWAFKREQPSDPEVLAQSVATCIGAGEPISFVLYWGKGPRAHIGAPEHACLDFLGAMGRRIARAYAPGALFNLCLTDTHARLNGHPETAIDSYFGDVAHAAAQRGMTSERLSRLVAGVAPTRCNQEERDGPMLDALERCAARWYRGGSNVREGARTYLAMNRVESRAVAAHFRGSVFVTFNGSMYRDLFPRSMPIFYMYSLKRGTAVKPWFMDEIGRPYDSADMRDGPGAA